MRPNSVLAALVMVITSACASGSSSGGQRMSTTRDVITQEEIAARAADASTAFQIIQKLRPQMLTGRGYTMSTPNDPTADQMVPKVYVDNVMFGEMSSLNNVAATQVLEVRFISARDATTRWGTGHVGGVILVSTKR